MGLGRKGERVANTPFRSLPPRRGGRTVAYQEERDDWENSQISQICENSSSPRRASGLRNSGSKTMADFKEVTMPLCLGIPNLLGK